MKITRIEAAASRTFNHPYESYSNFRSSFGLRAEIDEWENPVEAMKALRTMVENEAENHKQEILTELKNDRLRTNLEQAIHHSKGAPALLGHLSRRLAEETGLLQFQREDISIRIEELQKSIASLPEHEARLAAIPTPLLLPKPEIHPGHPDHPDTQEDY